MTATLQKVHHQNCGPTVFKTAEQRPNSLALLGLALGFRFFLNSPLSHLFWFRGLGFRVYRWSYH